MQFFGYLFFRLLLFMFWLTPFFILYLHSEVIFFLIYRVFGYRKKVVLENLKKSFPEKTDREIQEISKRFYRNLSDIMVEGIKGFSMSKESLIKRYKVLNPEKADIYFEQNRSIIGIGSHYCNWEWGVLCFSLQFKHKTIGLYKPLSNKYIDKYIKKTRAAWGMNLVSIYETAKIMKQSNSESSLYFMIADQSPSNTKKAYWIDFLNQDTACLHGPENYSKQYNLPVLYGHVERVKRGYYTIFLSEVATNPQEKSPSEITNTYMKILENAILQKPENWLWSHRRWKRKR